MYTDKVIDHFMNPRNVGTVKDANGMGSAGDQECGDYLEISLKIEDSIIKDIGFKVHGCAGAIATSSMITEMAKGKHILQAYHIKKEDVVDALDDLPEEKIHCSLLGTTALKRAIKDYMKNNPS